MDLAEKKHLDKIVLFGERYGRSCTVADINTDITAGAKLIHNFLVRPWFELCIDNKYLKPDLDKEAEPH